MQCTRVKPIAAGASLINWKEPCLEFRSDSDQIFGEKNFEQVFWESLTCWTEAASAQGSLPRVSSLGVSFGGLNFIPTLLLEPTEELDLQMILDPLSLLVATILTVSTLRPPNCAPLSSLLVHFIQFACHCTQGYQTESPCHWGLQLLTLTSSEGGIPINIRVQLTQELLSWIQVSRCLVPAAVLSSGKWSFRSKISELYTTHHSDWSFQVKSKNMLMHRNLDWKAKEIISHVGDIENVFLLNSDNQIRDQIFKSLFNFC